MIGDAKANQSRVLELHGLDAFKVGKLLVTNTTFGSCSTGRGYHVDETIGVLVNGFSRYVWGYLLDIYKFRTLMLIINGMLVISIFTIQLTSLNIFTYCLPIIVAYLSLGAIYSLLPGLIIKVFG